MVICLERSASDLHMVHLMPLPLTISCSSKSRLILPFWCWLTQVVLAKIQEGRKTVVWGGSLEILSFSWFYTLALTILSCVS